MALSLLNDTRITMDAISKTIQTTKAQAYSVNIPDAYRLKAISLALRMSVFFDPCTQADCSDEI